MNARPVILDCSVLVKAILTEAHSEQARGLLASGRRFLAPDLMPIELGNVLWKKVQRGDLTVDEAREAHRGLTSLAPVRILPSMAYHHRALELALTHGRSFYDSLYLAVAEAEDGLFVTADERMVNAMAGTAMADHLHWLGRVLA
jgi:predicted nucleic acid-binding protein